MTDHTLTIGSGRYDTTSALFDGNVSVKGFDTRMVTATTLPEIFSAVMLDQAYDAAELGLTFYLRALDRYGADLPYVAIPVFPVRMFRHSAIFVHADSEITEPADLAGRTIGEFGVYGQDPGVWMKGILMEEYGFRPESNRWVIGGLDRPSAPFGFTTHPHPDDVEVTAAPPDAALADMLEDGRIDALFTANVPQRVLDGTTRIRRLFEDFEPVERDYHRRTGIFPMMRTVVVSRRLLDEHPTAAQSVYDAFLESKESRAEQYRQSRRLYGAHTMVPWMLSLLERNMAEFDHDWWPYGLSANRTGLDTFLRYHREQGLSQRRWTADEVFLPL